MEHYKKINFLSVKKINFGDKEVDKKNSAHLKKLFY